jgi:hypothetical protein
MPSRNDDRNDNRRPCPACGRPFLPTGRRHWCSDACRQAGWRRRQPHPPLGPPAALPPRRSTKADTVYECPACQTRYLGEQYCNDCNSFCHRIGTGGPCPHCDEPVAISDLITVTP